MAKEFLDEREMSYDEISADDDVDLVEKLKNETGKNTFPFIFVHGNFIGGLRELMDMYDF
jgi:glutaredoxin